MRRALGRLALAALLPCATTVGQAQGAFGGAGRGDAPRRAQMEQQLRRNLWQIAKQRIGLTDAQMVQLERTSQRFDDRRRALAAEEREQRVILRQEVVADARADQDRVAKALDRLHELQRARVDLQIEEQHEFAAFMTPVQRAKYAALQEHVRRRADELRRLRPDSSLERP